MIKFLERKFNEWRRRRTLALIRRKFAESGHPPDDLDDLNIEAVLTLDEWRIEQIQLTANSIYFALRSLVEQRKDTGGRNKLAVKNLKNENF